MYMGGRVCSEYMVEALSSKYVVVTRSSPFSHLSTDGGVVHPPEEVGDEGCSIDAQRPGLGLET